MPVFIQEINVQNLGPLRQFSLKFKKFNLIYGRNERGKTHLVEFVIRSLFRNTKEWKLRQQNGGGKVVVAGLSDGRPVEFSPASEKKLEDFWEQNSAGLPPDFSKLLVVKGAEVELSKADGGANKDILKRLLSSREVLEKISSRISTSIQKCELANGEILGPNTGENKKRKEGQELLQKFNELFDEIDRSYSGGRRQAITDELESLQQQIAEQMKAKQFLAYQSDRELTRLREERGRIPSARIQEVRTELNLLKQKSAEYRNKREAQRESEATSQHYEWLKSAQQVYQNAIGQQTSPPQPWLLLLSLALIGLATVFAIFKLTFLTVAALVAVLISGWFYFQKQRQSAGRFHENQELENIRAEFKNLFGRELTGAPVILELLQNLEEDYNRARWLKNQLTEDHNSIKDTQRKLEEQIAILAGEKKDPKTWDEVLRLLDMRAQKLDNQIHDKDKLLARLSVDESDYVKEPPLVEYSKQTLDSLEQKRRKLEAEMEAETRKLETLKQRICDATRQDIVTSWPDLIEALRLKREQVVVEFRQKTAEIVGKIAVRTVINELRKTEDSKILAGLKSPAIETPLFQVTGRYKSLDLAGDELMVSDTFNTFSLSELSSGAQEQVLLALRIGFSTHLMNRDRLFLILDDAFQYSDWERRKLLVDKVAALANDGWQIIYFTMDDNIRGLFDSFGEQFGDDYQFTELTPE